MDKHFTLNSIMRSAMAIALFCLIGAVSPQMASSHCGAVPQGLGHRSCCKLDTECRCSPAGRSRFWGRTDIRPSGALQCPCTHTPKQSEIEEISASPPQTDINHLLPETLSIRKAPKYKPILTIYLLSTPISYSSPSDSPRAPPFQG